MKKATIFRIFLALDIQEKTIQHFTLLLSKKKLFSLHIYHRYFPLQPIIQLMIYYKSTILLVFFALLLCFSNAKIKRIHNMDTLSSMFQKQFCFGCKTNSAACRDNFIFIKNQATNNFNISIIQNNTFGIKQIYSQIRSVTKNYTFPNKFVQDVPMKYLILSPIFPTNTTKLKGVILYFHPTVFGKRQLPSSLGHQIHGLAALYCSQGYALVIPDYIGYEYNSDLVHPYILYPQQNVQSGISALNDANNTLVLRYSQSFFDVFTVGYSEGAAYSLWAEKCLTDPLACPGNKQKLQRNYIFKGSIGLQGPYDLNNVVYPFLKENIDLASKYHIIYQPETNYGKPGLISMVMNSYTYFENIQDMRNVYQYQFYSMWCPIPIKNNCLIDGRSYKNLTEILSSNETSIDIAKAIAFAAFGKTLFDVRYLSFQFPKYDIDHNNDVQALVNINIVSKKPFTIYLQNSSAIQNAPSKKVFIFSLERDSIVSVRNSDRYFETFNSTNRVRFQKFPNFQHLVCTSKEDLPVDHNGAQILANVYALAYINNQTSSIQ